jgi:citronellol/citronellal dehydrogenase
MDIEDKRFDLLQQINVRGTFLFSCACVPHLRLSLAPPLTMRPAWFGNYLPYTISTYGMSMVMFGLAEELRPHGIACNALWPRTTIATAAVEFALSGAATMRRSRIPEIMAEAACAILCRDARAYSGRFVLDDEVLREEGVVDFDKFRYDPSQPSLADIFVDEEGI